jgi:hypothetical protein
MLGEPFLRDVFPHTPSQEPLSGVSRRCAPQAAGHSGAKLLLKVFGERGLGGTTFFRKGCPPVSDQICEYDVGRRMMFVMPETVSR